MDSDGLIVLFWMGPRDRREPDQKKAKPAAMPPDWSIPND
jgi:hypothetical protein